MFAITAGSLKAIVRSPSAVIFSIAFPLVFILVFGFIGANNKINLLVTLSSESDTSNSLYQAIDSIPGITLLRKTKDVALDGLRKGEITAELTILKNASSPGSYSIHLRTSEAVNQQNLRVLQSLLEAKVIMLNAKSTSPNSPAILSTTIQQIPGRKFKTIDFILPGQLGFSLLSSAVFGVAFLFFQLRQQLVLKRFYATPIKRPFIILGEALSRVIFQLSTTIVIVSIGFFFFDYTLVNGLITFIQIIMLSFVALLVFMGFGFIVTGTAKNENTIPPMANVITLPQFLLAGTFFPIDVLPTWLQPLCKILPLTHFNDAMRMIAFEGANIYNCWFQLAMLGIWGVVVYAIAVRVFKWE